MAYNEDNFSEVNGKGIALIFLKLIEIKDAFIDFIFIFKKSF